MNRNEQEMEAQRNRQTIEQLEDAFVSHHQFGVHPAKVSKREKQVSELFCSCNGLKCDGICRETHLKRPRFANPKPKKNAPVNKMWAEKCPEAYEKPINYRT